MTFESQTLASRKSIYLALAKLVGLSHAEESVSDMICIDQWIDFISSRIVPELKHSKDLEGVVFAPLHAALAKKTFLCGLENPSIADWAVFSILFNRIKAMSASVAARNYRLVRWLSYMQHLFLQRTQVLSKIEKGDKEVSPFAPAVFDLAAIRAAIDGVTIAPAVVSKPDAAAGKKQQQKEAKQKPAEPIPVASHPFARVDLRVGKILKVEKHPNADRLYVETVDVGDKEPRVVVSGLVEHVPIEELQDRLCMFICNLKPATLCKVVSSAMLLVSKSEDGSSLEPLIIPAGSKAGDRITIEGVIPQPDEVIKPKDPTWEDVRCELKVIDGVVTYKSQPLQVGSSNGKITSTKVPNGLVS